MSSASSTNNGNTYSSNNDANERRHRTITNKIKKFTANNNWLLKIKWIESSNSGNI